MDSSLTTDVVVLGGGPTGENVADYAHKGGLDAVIVERDLLGGECSFWACMPSKALLRPGDALAGVRRVDGARQAVRGGLDVAAVLARRDGFAAGWDDAGQVAWAEGAGLRVVRGHGRVTGERVVTVGTPDGGEVTIEARHAVVVATGSVPVIPSLDGLDEAPFWTTREATAAQSVPGRLVVLGAGVAGTELAQAFARLGSDVTLLARDAVLRAFAAPARELVAAGLQADGVDVRLGVSVRRVERRVGANDDEPGGVLVHLDDDSTILADELLVATGRRPATGDVGLEWARPGLEPGDPLDVDDSGRVPDVPWLYGAGDVTGRAPLTHQGKYAARAVGTAIAQRAAGKLDGAVEAWSDVAATADGVAVPQVVFSDPQVASVGHSADAARDAGLQVRTVELEIAVAGSSLYADDYAGWAQLVIDDARDVVVGATFCGPDVAELLHAATIAVVGEVPMSRLWHAVPAYPTVSEVWLRLLEADRFR
ncbi:pyridine nucleotide-disulphide oxidoreductase dimerisation region [Beutenbergia cavernae DSM 12333]|uniref:Pyridine nucleotide-disulphide oxidoreductase dimerisation region n=1 Tax=Beutenbergia cavernae (strain ATCC BAA-8 / DSM 12333 / CCUG 43141 / JCM 11478 / NBRC 16432 / NCIMB 13614 / HKI 0122) TaxID=471853 RepID=C5C2W0_BEUC1|nr:NAD(P)/FAD-dependent oxidoreductase [Beutenbergia cavernae]ACQ81804.1 pyridine nucleotide-disulphide oxidoreductase dimerisation region [Beutenbergia cavernae DSM 12333]